MMFIATLIIIATSICLTIFYLVCDEIELSLKNNNCKEEK